MRSVRNDLVMKTINIMASVGRACSDTYSRLTVIKPENSYLVYNQSSSLNAHIPLVIIMKYFEMRLSFYF